ncbi:hypothetical protein [Streptomyces sp. NPDC006879]|uniref:caspase, EACC1-associated type n=1 Tax=Streptomyces sp. NPDC006879 TaxID=3364767 RepID=UPI00369FDB3A
MSRTDSADWGIRVPDRDSSRAVLTATATHQTPSELLPIPQVSANLTDLEASLTGKSGLFDPAHVQALLDPASADAVLDALPSPGSGTELDLLLFYYAGHGLLNEDKQLCLALPGSEDRVGRTTRTSLPVSAVFESMKGVRAHYRVAILDCCFSGRAVDAASASHIHLLTATGPTRKAHAEAGRRHTAFTEGLLHLLDHGIPDGGRHLDLATVYRRLGVSLPAARPARPTPAQRSVNFSGDLAIGANPAHGTALTRQGLMARARFAGELRDLGRLSDRNPGQALRLLQAVQLMSEVVTDGMRAFAHDDPGILAYRTTHASMTAQAGAVAEAVELLEVVVRDWETVAPPGDAGLEAARACWNHWLGSPPGGEPQAAREAGGPERARPSQVGAGLAAIELLARMVGTARTKV